MMEAFLYNVYTRKYEHVNKGYRLVGYSFSEYTCLNRDIVALHGGITQRLIGNTEQG
jgi:hypothetical protein